MMRLLSCLMTACLLIGCASKPASLVESGTVAVSHAPTEEFRWTTTDVWVDKSRTVVHGTVYRLHRHILRGHVHVVLADADGKVIEDTEASWNPKAIGGSRPRYMRFTAYLESAPPPGSTVRVSYVPGPHQEKVPQPSRSRPPTPEIGRKPANASLAPDAPDRSRTEFDHA